MYKTATFTKKNNNIGANLTLYMLISLLIKFQFTILFNVFYLIKSLIDFQKNLHCKLLRLLMRVYKLRMRRRIFKL